MNTNKDINSLETLLNKLDSNDFELEIDERNKIVNKQIAFTFKVRSKNKLNGIRLTSIFCFNENKIIIGGLYSVIDADYGNASFKKLGKKLIDKALEITAEKIINYNAFAGKTSIDSRLHIKFSDHDYPNVDLNVLDDRFERRSFP
ncbi:hypothetical protein ACTL6P_15375 [Endozoicomonas acroporae]|uniref:hypothetical protein n=1 Tax=Endozoicomonas acroporae TaxID=1701104 RepID=UPI000C78F35C|nr:hypothetical protein [Endozoicomonas acroporae]